MKNILDKYSNKLIIETLQSEAYKVSSDLNRLPELLVIIDLYMLKNDLGDILYKAKNEVLERLNKKL